MNHLPTPPIVREAINALDAFGAVSAREARILLGYWARSNQLTTADVETVVNHYAGTPVADVTPESVRPDCPLWCVDQHQGEQVVDGFDMGTVHQRTVIELTGDDPAWINRPATVAVYVEALTGGGAPDTPARIVLTATEGAEGHYPGSEGAQGWSGTAEQAGVLARALLAAVRTVRADLVERPDTAGRTFR